MGEGPSSIHLTVASGKDFGKGYSELLPDDAELALECELSDEDGELWDDDGELSLEDGDESELLDDDDTELEPELCDELVLEAGGLTLDELDEDDAELLLEEGEDAELTLDEGDDAELLLDDGAELELEGEEPELEFDDEEELPLEELELEWDEPLELVIAQISRQSCTSRARKQARQSRKATNHNETTTHKQTFVMFTHDIVMIVYHKTCRCPNAP